MTYLQFFTFVSMILMLTMLSALYTRWKYTYTKLRWRISSALEKKRQTAWRAFTGICHSNNALTIISTVAFGGAVYVIIMVHFL